MTDNSLRNTTWWILYVNICRAYVVWVSQFPGRIHLKSTRHPAILFSQNRIQTQRLTHRNRFFLWAMRIDFAIQMVNILKNSEHYMFIFVDSLNEYSLGHRLWQTMTSENRFLYDAIMWFFGEKTLAPSMMQLETWTLPKPRVPPTTIRQASACF